MTSVTLRSSRSTFVCAAFVICLAAALPAALRAQSTPPAPTQKSEKMTRPDVRTDTSADKSTAAKSIAAKRQKLKDCGAKWQDEKKAKGLTGKAAYLKFLSACLKG